MNAERLTLLTTELRKWPCEQFNFGVWVDDDWKGKPDLSCGTSACALGVATTIPVFQALGLKLTKDKYGIGYVIIDGKPPVIDGRDTLLLSTSLESAMTIFELTLAEARYLFVPDQEPCELFFSEQVIESLESSPNDEASPTEVANHIERYILSLIHI